MLSFLKGINLKGNNNVTNQECRNARRPGPRIDPPNDSTWKFDDTGCQIIAVFSQPPPLQFQPTVPVGKHLRSYKSSEHSANGDCIPRESPPNLLAV